MRIYKLNFMLLALLTSVAAARPASATIVGREGGGGHGGGDGGGGGHGGGDSGDGDSGTTSGKPIPAGGGGAVHNDANSLGTGTVMMAFGTAVAAGLGTELWQF